jgi:hypothetical protein
MGETAECPWCHVEGPVIKANVGILYQGLPIMVKAIDGCFCVQDLDFASHQPIAVMRTDHESL